MTKKTATIGTGPLAKQGNRAKVVEDDILVDAAIENRGEWASIETDNSSSSPNVYGRIYRKVGIACGAEVRLEGNTVFLRIPKKRF